MTTLTRAFAHYDATLKNVQWSMSAWMPDHQYLVVSLWAHHCRKGELPRTLEFEDSASRWHGPGNVEFRRNLEEAYQDNRPLRLIIAYAEDEAKVKSGASANKTKKTYEVREDLYGQILKYDADTGDYVIRFGTRDMTPALNA